MFTLFSKAMWNQYIFKTLELTKKKKKKKTRSEYKNWSKLFSKLFKIKLNKNPKNTKNKREIKINTKSQWSNMQKSINNHILSP